MPDMTTFDRIKELAEKRGKSLPAVSADLKFSDNLFYRWKTSNPKASDLAKVADYFHVTVDYLLGRDESEPKQTKVDLVELANKPKDFDWDAVLSAGGKPIPEEDKELIRRLFAHKLSD